MSNLESCSRSQPHGRSRPLKPARLLRLVTAPSLGLAFILIAIVGTSCTTPPGAPDRSPIRIGYYGDLSGPTFNFGQSAKNGVLMAADRSIAPAASMAASSML